MKDFIFDFLRGNACIKYPLFFFTCLQIVDALSSKNPEKLTKNIGTNNYCQFGSSMRGEKKFIGLRREDNN